MHFLQKIDFPEKFQEKFRKSNAIFGFYVSNYPKISPKNDKLGGTFQKKNQSNGRGPRVEFYKIDQKNSNDTPIDSP